MNGLLIIDKPAGMSSFDVIRRLRRCCRTKKVGHAGTLDPLATGVLPVALGSATRLLEYLMATEKVYRATLQLGAATDTQDSEGRVIATGDWHAVNAGAFEAACAAMTGTLSQTPPMFSALKKDGQPLYRLARQGVEVAREAREVRIESLEILAFDPPQAEIEVVCGKGTYIRTLCHDLGARLGCGAHLTSLRRTRCGHFDLADSCSLETIELLAGQDKPLPMLSPAQALADWPALQVLDGAVDRLRDGIAPQPDETLGEAAPGQRVRLMVGDNLAAVARRVAEEGPEKRFELLKVFTSVF
ncbi:MAG TPA: tRNA pseudouridine(55) synthase TruB [Desulfuromonadales bacterium]|nr:tRNA pseudouridine(55) synthase TruB [Desulfuromonadales bacterium]